MKVSFVKYLTLVILIGATFFSLLSCGEDSSKSSRLAKNELPNGEKIYLKYCKLCHGVDGDLELNGAANLTLSELEREEVKTVIQNGRNTMQPYKNLLSKEEIDAVTDYVIQLRDK